MKITNIVAFAVLAVALPLGTAHAALLGGTFNVKVYQADTSGQSVDAGNPTINQGSSEVQANKDNPLITGANLLYAGTYTGDINFFLDTGETNEILAFFESASGGTSSGLSGASFGSESNLETTLSTSGFDLTTVIDITWIGGPLDGVFDGGNEYGGEIIHDDGVSLYLDGVEVLDAGYPVSPTSTFFNTTTASGNYRLVYVAANNLPEQLTFNVSADTPQVTNVPEPASLAIWGLTMGGMGLVASRRRRRKLA